RSAKKKTTKPKAKPKAKAKAKAKTAARKTAARRDNAGHLEAAYARELRAGARETRRRRREPEGFVHGTHTNDDGAEDLAEEAVAAMTSGEDGSQDVRGQDVDEEIGG